MAVSHETLPCPSFMPPIFSSRPCPAPSSVSQAPLCQPCPSTQHLTSPCSCSDGRVAPSCLTCAGHCSNGGSCTMNNKMMPECQ